MMADDIQHSEPPLTSDERLVAYFLGELPEDESEILETQLFSDTELAARAFALEDELGNDYARGGLSPTQRRAFEQNYLVTEERQARLEFAQNLLQQWQAAHPVSRPVEVRAIERPGWWQHLFTPRRLGYAVLLLVILVVWWRWTAPQQSPPVLVITLTPTPLSSPVPSITPSVTTSPANTPIALPSAKPAPNVLASITLAGGAIRTGVPGQTIPTLNLPPASATAEAAVEFKLLLLEQHHASYRAAVQNQSGQIIWRVTGLKPQAANANTPPTLVTRIPAQLLTAGDYVLLLTAKSPATSESTQVESYAFRVLRK